MAIRLSHAANSYLKSGSAPARVNNWAISVWFKADDVTTIHRLAKITFSDTDSNLLITARGDSAGDPVNFLSQRDGTSYYVSSASYSANTWHHVLMCTNDSNHTLRISLDGQAWVKKTSCKLPDGAPGAIVVGDDSGYGYSIEGCVAELAIWDVVSPWTVFDPLTGAGYQLAKGFSPMVVHSTRPKGYWRLLGEGAYQDIIGGRTLTPYNSPVGASDHPPIIG